MKILLATDGSPFSDAAVDEVAGRPWPENSEVKIISMADPPVLPAAEVWIPADAYFQEMEKVAEEQAQNIVNRAGEKVRSKQGDKLRIATEVIVGHPRYLISDEAERWGADLIVVGSHGYRGLTKLLLGSVSQAVASHAKCSVEIVRSHKG